MKRNRVFLMFIATIALMSCGGFWEGMASGMGSYGMGGYGMHNPYMAPIGAVPYGLRPDVYAANAAAAARAQTQANMKAMQQSTPATGVIATPVVTSTPASSSSNSSSSSSYSGSNSSMGRDCGLCLGTGKCSKCNGRGYYDVIGIGSGRHVCPVCPNHSGTCSSCGGSGKR